jgi:hypothetical protein
LVFAYLVLAEGKPVTRHELAAVLWDDAPPTSWESALRVLLSKLRRSLAGLAELEATGGGYRLELPTATWVDVLAAETAVREAEDRLRDDVVRVGAKKLEFKSIFAAPGGPGYYRGVVYGGGWLWVSQIAGATKDAVTRVDPVTGAERTIDLPRAGSPLAWSGAYGNLWIANFNDGSVTRLQPVTRKSQVIADVAGHPGSLAVDGNAVWVGDWLTPEVVRVSAVGSPRPRPVPLPGADYADNVWCVAVSADAVWATTPGATPTDAGLWRIDTKTSHVTRVSVPYRPTCVAANASGVWVTLRR